jgi:hypothetical protein
MQDSALSRVQVGVRNQTSNVRQAGHKKHSVDWIHQVSHDKAELAVCLGVWKSLGETGKIVGDVLH